MNIRPPHILLSMVIPVYNEYENIEELFKRLQGVLIRLNAGYEIIFIDDGSIDQSWDALKLIQQKNPHVKNIKLSRNYGQTCAFLAGFELARGDIIFTMDADLQYEPDDIPKFINKINEGFDLISGWRYHRNDSIVRKIISFVENWLIWTKTGIRLHDYGCAFMATRRDLIEKLLVYGSRARFIKPVLATLTQARSEVCVRHYRRRHGVSNYNIMKILRAGIDFMFSFSRQPENNSPPMYIIQEVLGA